MDPSERRQRAADEAAQWLVDLQGEPSQADRERYTDWLRESPLHIAEMIRIARVQHALEGFEEWPDLPPYVPSPDADRPHVTDRNVVTLPTGVAASASPSDPDSRKARGPARRRAALAAAVVSSCLIVVGAAAWLYPTYAGETIQTDAGERRQIVLTDGSEIYLDPQTRLRINYASASRRVFLGRGRVLFRVAKDPQRPFLVQTDDTVVRAVGTQFAVEKQSRSVVVTVSEGRVAVFKAAQSDEVIPSAAKGGTTAAGNTYLVANQQVTVESTGQQTKPREIDSARVLAWASGKLIFENDTVAHAVEEFNRYNRVQLRVSDPQLAGRPVSGTFNSSEPESFAAFVQLVAGARVTRGNNSVIILDTPP
jgi:transmembrane sensor